MTRRPRIERVLTDAQREALGRLGRDYCADLMANGHTPLDVLAIDNKHGAIRNRFMEALITKQEDQTNVPGI